MSEKAKYYVAFWWPGNGWLRNNWAGYWTRAEAMAVAREVGKIGHECVRVQRRRKTIWQSKPVRR